MIRRLFVLLPAVALIGACVGTANVAVNRNFDFSQVRRVAVIGFPDQPRRAGSGEMLTAAFEQSLLNAGYNVVEREQVAKIIDEQKLSGALDDKAVQELGRLLNVDALVTGKYTGLSGPSETAVVAPSGPGYGRHRGYGERGYGSPSSAHPQSYVTDGKVGVSVRMVSAKAGGLLWSATDETETNSLADAARALSDDILKAVKSTWPSSRK